MVAEMMSIATGTTGDLKNFFLAHEKKAAK